MWRVRPTMGVRGPSLRRGSMVPSWARSGVSTTRLPPEEAICRVSNAIWRPVPIPSTTVMPERSIPLQGDALPRPLFISEAFIAPPLLSPSV
jgi:hypothetical protein